MRAMDTVANSDTIPIRSAELNLLLSNGLKGTITVEPGSTLGLEVKNKNLCVRFFRPFG